MTRCEPNSRIIGAMIIDAIDETGYLRDSVEEIAHRLDTSESLVAEMLRTIQGFDPCGVGARDLAECLAIQLSERNRFDPAMQIFIANLPSSPGAIMRVFPVCVALMKKTSPIWRRRSAD